MAFKLQVGIDEMVLSSTDRLCSNACLHKSRSERKLDAATQSLGPVYSTRRQIDRRGRVALQATGLINE